VKDSLEWWQLISEKRCDGYSHLQEDGYNEALEAFFTIIGNAKIPRHPKT
jgi:hypothetical protein